MAEVAGLALGGVALITLFQSCVEFIEYIEAGRSLVCDLERGTTKVQFLRIRLQQWGQKLAINQPGLEVEALKRRWPDDSDIIMHGLSQIRQLLGKALYVSRQYQLDGSTLPHVAELTSFGCLKLEPSTRAGPNTIPFSKCSARGPKSNIKLRGIDSLRKRVKWAVQDKKKFDSLIGDLEFLISSLEELDLDIGPVMPRDGEMSGGRSDERKSLRRSHTYKPISTYQSSEIEHPEQTTKPYRSDVQHESNQQKGSKTRSERLKAMLDSSGDTQAAMVVYGKTPQQSLPLRPQAISPKSSTSSLTSVAGPSSSRETLSDRSSLSDDGASSLTPGSSHNRNTLHTFIKPRTDDSLGTYGNIGYVERKDGSRGHKYVRPRLQNGSIGHFGDMGGEEHGNMVKDFLASRRSHRSHRSKHKDS